MTYTTRRRRTILQFLQIFLTEARTFMTHLQNRSAEPTDTNLMFIPAGRSHADWLSSSTLRTDGTSDELPPEPENP